jgi:acetoacetate decarboxylase
MGDGISRFAISYRYLTDPERIARVLPPPLSPDERPEVHVNFWSAIPALEHDRRRIFQPGTTYGESHILLSCSFEGKPCVLELEMELHQDLGRSTGRDSQAFQKKVGQVLVDFSGTKARASVTRHGRVLVAMETEMLDEPADPRCWFQEAGSGWLCYAYRLHPDWRKGLIENEEVQLFSRGGAKGGYPTGLPENRTDLPRAGDPRRTTVLVDPWQWNPFAEFPIREWVGIACNPTGLYPEHVRAEVPRGEEGRTVLEPPGIWATISAEELEPWALSMNTYDRPIFDGTPLEVEGWPEKRSALVLTSGEIERMKSRESYAIPEMTMVDVQYELDPAVHAKVLPSVCRPGDRPLARILGITQSRGDFSPSEFTELWLMARCLAQGRPSWFALAHIVDFDGDCWFGRETFGYPSKLGEPEMVGDGMQYNIRGRRLYRDFFHAVVPLSLEEPAPHRDEFDVLGMHLHPYREKPGGDLVSQPWTVDLETARRADVDFVELVFPSEAVPQGFGLTDPWFELSPKRLVSAVAGEGSMHRFPCTTVQEMPDFLRFWLLSVDGAVISSLEADGTFLHPPEVPFWEQRFSEGGFRRILDQFIPRSLREG